MFGIFVSQHRKTRRLASDWLELAEKIFNYRRDVLAPADSAALNASAAEVRRLLAEKADTARLKLGIDALEAVLRRAGGPHYPKSGMVENVEFFLVAAIVILGLRAFFVQPFKIPTNSMWPSYYGMTGQVYAAKADEPGPAARALGFVAAGASARRVDAPATGEILLPVPETGARRGIIGYQEVRDRTWLVIPTKVREYTLIVGQTPVKVRVPLDYDMDTTLRDAFFPGDKRPLNEIFTEQRVLGGALVGESAGGRVWLMRTGKTVRAGERALSFDILTGDNLFVDRVSYHFVRPEVGQGFVFRTDNIRHPEMRTPDGRQLQSYYIKRLVGLPGDKLRVDGHTLIRNGEPITGADAFAKNAGQTENYVGYRALGNLAGGVELTVPEGQYMALGDNSANSADSRVWGGVPLADAVGRPLFIYYPFTKRWGPAR